MDGFLKISPPVFKRAIFTAAAIRRRPLVHLALLALAAAGVWQLASALHLLRLDSWPPPTEILRTLWNDLRFAESPTLGDQNRALPLFGHLLLTLQKWAVGFSIAAILGVAIGAALGTSRTMFAIGHPVVSVLRAMPSAAVWPIAVLLIGLGFKSQLVTIVFGAVWPALLNTLNSLASLSPEVRDTMEFMQLSRLQRFLTQIQWALPGIFTGLELSCSIGFLLAVTVEVFDSSNGGIGWFMDFHRTTQEYAHMYGAVLLTGLVGWGLNSLMHAIRGAVLFWERGVNTRGDLFARKLVALLPSREAASQIADKVTDGRLRGIITAEDVSTYLTRQFGEWRLEILYQGSPYFWPNEGSVLIDGNCIQRDIRIMASLDGAEERPILVAQSWLKRDLLSEDGHTALMAGELTLGQIVRGVEIGAALNTTRVETCISEKLGLAFAVNGAVETVKRVRRISKRTRELGVIIEYVPVLLGDERVFTA